jgi:Tfp pilus assembly protein PilV
MNALFPVAVGARPLPGHRRLNSGYTLLEVAVAAFVMLFAIASSFTALQGYFRMIDVARYSTLSGQILESQMDKLRLLTWTQLTDSAHVPGVYDASGALLSTTTTFTPDLSADQATKDVIANHFSCTQRIVPVATGGSPMVQITLTARWTGSDGHAQSLSYFTRYAQNGISDFFYTTHGSVH